jgi:hypothetical protein
VHEHPFSFLLFSGTLQRKRNPTTYVSVPIRSEGPSFFPLPLGCRPKILPSRGRRRAAPVPSPLLASVPQFVAALLLLGPVWLVQTLEHSTEYIVALVTYSIDASQQQIQEYLERYRVQIHTILPPCQSLQLRLSLNRGSTLYPATQWDPTLWMP